MAVSDDHGHDHIPDHGPHEPRRRERRERGRSMSPLHDERLRASGYLVPTVVESSNRGERAYDLYSRLLRRHASSSSGTSHRRHGGQPGLRPAALLGVRGPRQGDPPLHQLARRGHHRPLRYLRHDEVHQARRLDLLLRPGGVGGGRPPQPPVLKARASPSPTPASSCTSPTAGSRDRPATSSFRPGRSCACATS